jgi:hypothetical protein
MKAWVVLAVALAGCAAGAVCLSAAAPAPALKDKHKAVLYHPTRVGAKWVYTSDERDGVEEVTDAKEMGGARLVTVGCGRFPTRALLVSGKGICVVAFNVAELTEPLWLLKLPHAPGNKWEAVLAGEPWGRAVGSAKAYGPERVEVPAGTYQAIRVELELPYVDGREGKARKTTWYAPGVGKVKEVYGEKVKVLKSFHPGKGRVGACEPPAAPDRVRPDVSLSRTRADGSGGHRRARPRGGPARSPSFGPSGAVSWRWLRSPARGIADETRSAQPL